ncbi:MAG: hypothetical protein AB8B86_11615 [Pseudomonadales bacterium]
MANTAAIHCSLTQEDQRRRRSQVRATIVPQVRSVNSLADGLRIDFVIAEGLRELVEEFIALERECCSFLTFTLSVKNEDMSLLIQGPREAAQVIDMFRRTALGET